MPPTVRRTLVFSLPLLGLLGYAGYSLSKSEFRDDLTAGRAAVTNGNWGAAESYADRLDRAGRADAARLLRGSVWVGRARALGEGPDQTKALRAALVYFGHVRDPATVTAATVLAGECLVR